MLDKFQQIKKLKKLQDELGREEMEAEERSTKVVINGKMEIVRVELNPNLEKEEQEKALKGALNKAIKEAQKKAAESFSQIKGLGF